MAWSGKAPAAALDPAALEETALTHNEMLQVRDQLFELERAFGNEGVGPLAPAEEEEEPPPPPPHLPHSPPPAAAEADTDAEVETDAATATSSTSNNASSPPDGASTDEEDAVDALALRRLHSLFEEERFTDAGADEAAVSLGEGAEHLQFNFRQWPRLAARLGDQPTAADPHLGCPTEQMSATGATVWDSSVVVAAYLAHQQRLNDAARVGAGAGTTADDVAAADGGLARDAVRGRCCVELGAGCGVVSSLLWRLGAGSVVAAERLEIIPLLELNLEANCKAQHLASGSGEATTAATTTAAPPMAVPHMWGESVTPLLEATNDRRGPDLLLAVDCIYDEAAVAPLLSSLCRLGAGDSGSSAERRVETVVAVDESYRRPAALALFMASLEERGLRAEPVAEGALHPDIRRESVRIYRLVGLATAA